MPPKKKRRKPRKKPVNLYAAFKMEPEAAVKYFRSKELKPTGRHSGNSERTSSPPLKRKAGGEKNRSSTRRPVK